MSGSTADLDDQLLIVSSWAPPTIGGTPTVLARLLAAARSARPLQVEVIRQRVRPEELNTPPWPTTTLARPAVLDGVRGGHYVLAPSVFVRVLLRLRRRRHVRVVAIFPEESFALPAALACRMLRRPYALYMHNSFSEQALHPAERLLARLTEPWLVRGASPLMVLSEALQQLYETKYGVHGVIVPHVIDEAEYRVAVASDLPEGLEPHSYALFTGDVYDLNRDALARIAAVLRERFGERLPLVICGQKRPDQLASMGIDAAVVLRGLPGRSVVALQRYAGVLLAPLAFASRYQAEVTTAFPTKVAEYLATGRPILVHAPPDSLLARDAVTGGWAAVVTTQTEDALEQAIDDLLVDTRLQGYLAERSRAALGSRAPDVVVRTFLSALGVART